MANRMRSVSEALPRQMQRTLGEILENFKMVSQRNITSVNFVEIAPTI